MRQKIRRVLAKSRIHLQECPYSCGPSALLNALSLKGNRSHTEKELIRLCKAKPRIGTDNSDLVRVAKSVGLTVVEEKRNATIKDIERNIRKGASVIVNYIDAFDGEGHYNVATDYDRKALYFMDSSLGALRLRKNIFMRWWYNSDRTLPRWYVAVK